MTSFLETKVKLRLAQWSGLVTDEVSVRILVLLFSRESVALLGLGLTNFSYKVCGVFSSLVTC